MRGSVSASASSARPIRQRDRSPSEISLGDHPALDHWRARERTRAEYGKSLHALDPHIRRAAHRRAGADRQRERLRNGRAKSFQETRIRLEPIDYRNLRRDVGVDGLAADDDSARRDSSSACDPDIQNRCRRLECQTTRDHRSRLDRADAAGEPVVLAELDLGRGNEEDHASTLRSLEPERRMAPRLGEPVFSGDSSVTSKYGRVTRKRR